jgi:hypothetical protein
VWTAEVNGFLVDLRDMPREVQVIAYDKGMIIACHESTHSRSPDARSRV